MNGRLTTHVLDTANGIPAEGITIELFQISGATRTLLKSAVTNHDGRIDSPLLEAQGMQVATYELVFHTAAYFTAKGNAVTEPPFLDFIPIRFSVADADAHHHVPLLVSPWAYSTYRGS
ncbi:MAG TPA: hydroxyisourate hydrolase [Luteolibacter sp.]|nr:hydroxyisourate hydrolase [Luteolibacter sp.]